MLNKTWSFSFNLKSIVGWMVKLLTTVLLVYLLQKYIDKRIIYFISSYDAYEQALKNNVAVSPGDGEPGPLDHSKDNKTL